MAGAGEIMQGVGAIADAGASIYGAYQQNQINEKVLAHNIEQDQAELKLLREKFGLQQQQFAVQAPQIKAQTKGQNLQNVAQGLQNKKFKDFLDRQDKIRKGGF